MTTSFVDAFAVASYGDPVHRMRRVIPAVGCAVSAHALVDRDVLLWVQRSATTVLVLDDTGLDLVQSVSVRPNQVVFRAGDCPDSIRRALHHGITRFIVSRQEHVDHLAECAQRTTFVYLAPGLPTVSRARRIVVVGLHGDIDPDGTSVDWADAAERALCRTAQARTLGTPAHRIVLSRSADTVVPFSVDRLDSIVHAVDEALRQGCSRWRLARPAVTIAVL
ncbi:hypothetical protein HQ602_17065 [Rhodococcus kroppenstedtii]|uniref:hypothetical protein n=1 Tax=Rhodococcoides kroppenstedtii TaxID=293050 RepID=UPI001C9A4B63|nr:hypothetical protein [Rhodococcus kroppenstedtii]MBY6438087.1 hypothetical protein [Rhodococcus kroppenstedtii]